MKESTKENILGTLAILSLAVILISFFAYLFITANKANQKRGEKQKADYFECLHETRIGENSEEWCYDKFISR